MKKIILNEIFGTYAICKHDKQTDLSQLDLAKMVALIKNPEDVTVVYESINIPKDKAVPQKIDDGWSLFHISGEYAFDEAGIVLSTIKPLSENGVGVYVLSTFNSDLLLLKSCDVDRSVQYLKTAGHIVNRQPS